MSRMTAAAPCLRRFVEHALDEWREAEIDDPLDRRDINDRGFALTEQRLARVGAAEDCETNDYEGAGRFLELHDVYA